MAIVIGGGFGERIAKPADIPKACALLASEDAEFITGVCLEVDGGRCV